jgi:predicted tellurium resistance membrane protein TerC
MLENIGTLISLIFLEALLAIDNLLSFSFLINQAPDEKRDFVKKIALSAALVLRLLLLTCFLYFKKISTHISIYSIPLSSIIFFLGGGFLVISALEDLIFFELESDIEPQKRHHAKIFPLIIQIIVIDFIFSLDSIFVAITMTNQITLIVASIFFSIIFLYYGSSFLLKLFAMSWRLRILGLLFVLLLGIVLLFESMALYIDKNLLIATIIFSCSYETLITFYEQKLKKKDK